MYKACSYCGKIHDSRYKCRERIKAYQRRYKRNDIDRLHSKSAWAKKAREIKERSKYLCAVCLDEGIYNYNNLEVHHITKLREAPERLLDDDNLVCLCVKHHKEADAGRIDEDYLRRLALYRED